LWYTLRRVFADRLLTVQPRDGAPALVAVNDSATPWTVSATVSRRTLAGVGLAEITLSSTVPPGSAVTLPLPADLTTPADPATELLVADTGDARAWWFFAEDKDIAWPLAKYDTRVDKKGSTTLVTVTAQNILRDLTLNPDRLDPSAQVDDAGVTLLPGESVTFTVTGARGLDPTALTTRPVLRCVNDLI
jgi:beta-mannosidase